MNKALNFGLFVLILLYFVRVSASDNGRMSMYGDSSFSGINGVMDTYYTESEVAEANFNGIRTEITPLHEKLANGLNGIMDVFDWSESVPEANKKIEVPPVVFELFYPVNGYLLTAADKMTLEKTLKLLQSDKVKSVYLIGYADPTGSRTYNQKLSERRAAQVEYWLASQGVPTSLIKTIGAGVDNTLEDYQKARRVEMKVELK